MSESKAVILGCAGKVLSADEAAFYRDERPWGFILFARNIGEPGEVQDLVASLRDSVGRPAAPVFIDQEGGRVQRLRPPVAPNYPSGGALGALYRTDRQAGLRAAWLMARLHAFDLLRLGVTVDCLPVLDVPAADQPLVKGGLVYGLALSHDRTRVAFINDDPDDNPKLNGIHIYEIGGKPPRRILGVADVGGLVPFHLSFSADGKYLLALREHPEQQRMAAVGGRFEAVRTPLLEHGWHEAFIIQGFRIRALRLIAAVCRSPGSCW